VRKWYVHPEQAQQQFMGILDFSHIELAIPIKGGCGNNQNGCID